MLMKHNFTNRLFISLAILLVGAANASAYSDYYSKANAIAKPSAAGKVYVAYKKEATTSNGSSAESGADSQKNAPKHKYYFLAETSDEGYTFEGWFAEESGGTAISTSLSYNVSVTAAENVDNATINRYARWKGKTYYIAFNGNGATSGSMGNLKMTYGTAKNLTANAYKRAYTVTYNADGGSCGTSSATATYTFQNWNTNDAGTGTTYTDKQKVNNLTKTSDATFPLYAIWSSASVTLPAATKAGGVLEGWYNGTTKIGDPGDSYTPTANVTLKAKWIDKYTPVFTGSNQSLKVGGEVSGVFSFEHTDNPEAHITVTSISDVNNGNGKVIEYNAATNKIIAHNAGTATIYFTQNETSTIKSGTSATYTVTVTKYEPLFTLNKNTLELEQTATLSCEHTDGQTVTFSPEGKVSYNASTGVITATTLGETTMTVNQPETNSIAAKTTNFTISVIKKTPTLTVKMNNVARTSLSVQRGSTTSISFDKVSDAEVVVTPVSGTQYASYVNGVMTAGAEGTAKYRASLAETDTYQAKSVDFTLTVTSSSSHLPISGKEYTLGSGSARDWTHSYETLSFSGIPDKLSFNFAYDYVAGGGIGNPTIQCPSGLAWLVPDDQEGKGNTHLLYVEESSDGSSWTTIWTDDSGDSKDTKSSGDIPLSKTTRHLRFHHSCNFKNTYTNIRVTELKYVETPSPESIDFGEAIINSDEITKTATVNWCNIAPMTVTSNDPRIIVSPATFGNFEQYATQPLTFKYQPSHTEESVNTTVTLTNATGTYNKTINVKAATVRRPQVITWNEELSSTGYAMNVGEQYPDVTISPVAQSTNKGRITFTSANSSIIEVIADTALLAKGIGKVNITAHQAGDAEYQPVDSTVQFTVTDLRKQSIEWNQDLFDLLTTSDPRTLTATATSGMAISYTSADPSIVKVEGNTLTVVSAGETYITATQAGGTDAEGVEWLEISQNNYVIVRDPASPCGEMAATKSSLTFKQSNAPEPFALQGIPGELTFKARHEKKTSTIWGTTTTYSALIVEQYALKNNLWDWYEVFNQVVGTSDGSYGPYTLDESATKLRVRTLESGANHIVSNLRVTRKKIMTADVTAIDATADCNAIWQKEITVTHSNIDMMTVTSKQGLLTFSEPTLGSGCRDYGDDSFTAKFTPLQKNIDYYDTIVISDNKANPTTVEIPVHIHSKGLTQYINDFVVPATALSTDAIYASATATSTLPVTFATSDESIARVVNGNQIEVVSAGEVKVIAIQDGGDRFDSVAVEKTLTISKVTPSIPVQSVDVRYADEWNNAQLATCKATVTWQGTPDTEVNGEFKWISNEGEITLNPGSYNYSVTFKPTDTGKYNEVSGDVEVNVLRALSVISAQDKTINARLPEQTATINLSTLVNKEVGNGELSFEFIDDNVANATISNNTFEATAVGQYAVRAIIAQTDYYERSTADLTLTVIDGIVFDGSNGSSWGDSDSWGGAQPTANDRVIIDADVTITADDLVEVESLTINENKTVTVKDGGVLTVGAGNSLVRSTYGNIIVEAGGQLILGNGAVNVNDFTLYSGFDGNQQPKSGQVTGQDKLSAHGHAYFILDLDPSGQASYGWYTFAVPFPVDEMRGVSRYDNGQWTAITNGVNYAVMAYHEDLRAQGQRGWKKYSGILQPGVGYTMTTECAINRYRFTKTDTGEFNTSMVQQLQASAEGETVDRGWNSLGNGTMSYITLDEEPLVQIYDHASNTYTGFNSASLTFAVGAAYFVQTAANGSELNLTSEVNGTIRRAPQREQSSNSSFCLSLNADGKLCDNLFITCDDEAEATYTIGRDVQKMGNTTGTTVARLWTNAKGTDLCAVSTTYADNQAIIPMHIFAPADGEYTLSLDSHPADDVYLTRNGIIVWDMNMGDYTFDLSAGADDSYALQIVRRVQNVATGVDAVDADNHGTIFAEKMIVNGQLFILRDGILFDAQGKKVTNL